MDIASSHTRRLGGSGQPDPAHRPVTVRIPWARWLEALGVVLSPAAAALLLRLRLMAPSALPDPALHTTYLIAPRDVFTRYAAAYAATGRLREGARAGFLVPARLADVAFGAIPGFFVTRYLLALIAVVPVYLLLRRLYGPPAGVAGILVVMASPVVVTAWGTDYPDSAVVSYAAGAMACLAMPSAPQRRRAWLAAAGVLLTLAVWAHGVAVPLAGATLIGYLAVRLLRDRARLAGDLALLAGVFLAVTGLLIAASAVVLGHANFIALTWQAARFLSQPAQLARWHSANWRWAPFVTYLLVPPAVLGAYAVAVTRRGRTAPVPVLMVGAAAAAQLVTYAVLQFAGPLQTLEQYFFSSTLWAGVCLAFAVTVAELTLPLAERPAARWLPAVVLLAVPLGYEAGPRVPSFGWAPYGAVAAAGVIAAAAAARGSAGLRHRLAAVTGAGLALAVLGGAVLVLTVAPVPAHPPLPGTAVDDTAPDYASALGGSSARYIDGYRIATELPAFVRSAAYPGEQLMTWRVTDDFDLVLYYAMYHGWFNSLYNVSPDFTAADRYELKRRRPAELLLMGRSAAAFPRAERELAGFRPIRVRAGTLRSGPLVLHVWLLRLRVYYHPPRR